MAGSNQTPINLSGSRALEKTRLIHAKMSAVAEFPSGHHNRSGIQEVERHGNK
jgi:hypothetical protein